jgi:DNA-binding PadR family transcriptional regulator
MSIRHAILGILTERPMHGYGLKQVFDDRVSPLWGLSTGQIYQTLAALERSALVVGRGERRGRRATRRVYSVTESGRREFLSWLREEPAPTIRPFREDLMIRLMMIRRETAPHLRSTVDAYEHEARMLLHRIDEAQSERVPPASTVDLRSVFLLGMLNYVKAEIVYLQRFRTEIDRWSAERAQGRGTDDR